MPVRQVIQGVVPVKVYTNGLDPMARKQLENLAQLPFIHHHVAAMPDVHCGIGATIGSVIPTRGAIIPSAHGAGRRMSRTQARRQYTAEHLAEQTMGIECRKDSGVVDEIPSAYKDIDEVMANQSDLVEIVHTLRQMVNVKG